MKTSLQQALHEHINKYGDMSMNQVEAICREMKHRLDTGRRKLEPDISPNVGKLKNQKGHITGYYLRDDRFRASGQPKPAIQGVIEQLKMI